MREQAAERGFIPITNVFMFGHVMRNEEICKGFLETVLGMNVGRIEYINAEQTTEPGLDSRGVRLDVYAEAGRRVFDVEMQVADRLCLGKRMRYYQSAIDAGLLEKGADFDELRESYIIFLCTHDPYGLDLPLYRFERICVDESTCDCNCGAHWMVLNSKAYGKLPDGRLRDLLKYVDSGKSSGDGLVSKIDSAVHDMNRDASWVDSAYWSVSGIVEDAEREVRIARRYYKKEGLREGRELGLSQGLAEGRAKGHAEGKAEGRAEGRAEADRQYKTLIDRLLDAGRLDDLRKMTDDAAYRQKLCAEFGI